MTGFRTRIAPTPSGYLHAGNALNFLITQRLAREQAGTLLLRIDDLDAERVRPAFVEDIFDSLAWLGIEPDEGPRNPEEFHRHWSQRARLPAAHALLERLRSANMLFSCTCSRQRSATCSCRGMDLPFEGPDRTWRLRVPSRCGIRVPDLFSQPRKVDLATAMPDPVLRQRNGSPAYQIVSLADDIRFQVNVIVRGEDLLPSTACQLFIAEVLEMRSFLEVRSLHHALLTDAHGRKLSKSEGADSLRAMRLAGTDPAVLHDLATKALERARAKVR